MTDFPSIFSGRKIRFFDPHERYFWSDNDNHYISSRTWNLDRQADDIARLEDQFAPFAQPLFGIDEDILRGTQKFHGTLFRFPLRAEGTQSELCWTTYDVQKVRQLFSSLQVDAHMLLLFLNHITKIEFYEKTPDSEHPMKTATIRLATSVEQAVTSKRKEFLQEIGKRRDASSKYKQVSTSYQVTTELMQEEHLTVQDWAVSQLYGNEDDDELLAKFSDDLRLLPWVAAAVPVSSTTSLSAAYLERPTGHIFCFLPLPLGMESPTGLRVHVHGYFAVDSNRRHLKERTGEQLTDKITDRDLLWNEYLVSRLLPTALVNLALSLVEPVHALSNPAVRRDAIFSTIPQLDEVKGQWKPLATAFLEELPQLPVFYSPVNGGQFLSSSQALFDDIEDNLPITELVRRLLHQNYTNLVSVPEFVFDQLGSAAVRVTPSVICTALRNTEGDLSLTDEDRTILLEYLIDNLEDKTEIVGTRLLALADGSWIKFTSLSDDNQIYVDSKDHPRSLLPSLDHLFVRNDVVDICRKIISATKNGKRSNIVYSNI